eukprot:3329091-Heterocapsa_arctica.AAC.1
MMSGDGSDLATRHNLQAAKSQQVFVVLMMVSVAFNLYWPVTVRAAIIATATDCRVLHRAR